MPPESCRANWLGIPSILCVSDREFSSLVGGRVLLLCCLHFDNITGQHYDNCY